LRATKTMYNPLFAAIVYSLHLLCTLPVFCCVTALLQVRAFPFSKYPPHVQDLGNYAFKALVLQEALLLHRVVLWIDAGEVD